LIPTLLSGGSVVVPHRFSVSQYWDWLDEHQCTWSAIVPTIVSQLLDWQDPRADSRGALFERIRFLRSSSAPLSPSLHREFLGKFDLRLIQAMGSTECGNIFSNPQTPGENKVGSPGLPWGFEARIVNRDGFDVPQGESGEVLLRGPGVMKCYYKDPDGTAAVVDKDGWLHTGDLAYRDEDGYFFVVGRSKELIIKGGVNIAPKQIDEVIESHPSVLEAAAVGVPDRYVGEDLVAFVVTRARIKGDESQLLTFCESRLGAFKTPTRIYFVSDLPKGPSGKVQRLKLVDEATRLAKAGADGPRPEMTAGAKQESASSAETSSAPIERIIVAAWAKVLGQPHIDASSNFFALGGHSLLAIQCLSQLRDKLPVSLSLSDFFEHATVAQQAALIARRLARNSPAKGSNGQTIGENSPDTIPLRDRSQPCPLSPQQQRLWFMEQLNPGVPVYNEAEAVRLTGQLNVDALERAINVVISRHEMLRTTIQAADGEPMAVVHGSWPLKIKKIDLSAMDATARQAEVDRLLIHEPRKLYRLDTEPGIRATLIRTGATEHVFILMMHHIICDWSSEGVIWRELSALYRAFSRGEQLELPPLPIQHGDYAAWQHQNTQRGFAEDLAYWEENLRGAPELLELPTDRPRPHAISYRGERQRFRIDPALAEALRESSRKEKTSLFTVFAAALDILLYRYTDREDILVGIPLGDRDRAELQSVIGFLLHTHVVRTQWTGDVTFRELFARTQKAVLGLHDHRAVPFDHVVGKVQPKRNLSYSPLFQVMLNWRDRDQQLSFIGMEGLQVESLLAETNTSKFDLTFMLTDGGDEIWLEMEYSTDLFDGDRIGRMVGHYQRILESVAADPTQRLSQLPLLTEAERTQLLVDWNKTESAFPKDYCIHELFEEQVKRTPDAVAVVFEGTSLTYRQLNERSNQLASHLHKLGVANNGLVGICVERSADMVVGVLGILKAGGAYVPLDPKYPKDRLAFVLEDARPLVLLTQRALASHLPAHEAQVVCLDALPTVSSNGVHAGDVKPQASDLAYVLYTSGSTGKPKGVEIPHRAVVNFLCSMHREPGLTSQDTLLAVTTLSFDIAGLEIFGPLTSGGRVVIAGGEVVWDGSQLLSLMKQCSPTVMQATPATWRMLLAAGWEGNPKLKILCGGEAWSTELAGALLPRCASLWNMYGPTETTIWSSVAKVQSGKPVVIGPPIANTTFYILDAHGQPTPVGIAGELHIGGVGLARGYHNRPELTAEKFIADPFSADPLSSERGARLYRTGDLARYLPDGNIEFLGRIDHQVKIRGFRIELGEIESVLSGHADVANVAVVAREDIPGDKRLVAYLTAKNGQIPTPADLRSLLGAKVPEYMIPSAFVTLERFPLTPNGKVDRKALPAPDTSRSETERSLVAPGNAAEKTLAGIWCEILGIKQVGIHDNFFELGGHSLLAVRLQARVEKEMGHKLPLIAIFQSPTIQKLARTMSGARDTESTPYVLTLRSEGEQTPLFLFHDLTFAQHLVKHLKANRPVYGIYSNIDQELKVWEETGQVTLSMQELASRSVAELQRVQPHGPYCIAGFCFGGVVAFEVASQLVRQGHEVASLGLLAAFYRPGIKSVVPIWLRHWAYHARHIASEGPGYIARRSRERSDLKTLSRAEWLRGSFAREIVSRYRGNPYPGPAVLIRTTVDPHWASFGAKNGWDELLVNGLQVENVRCTHDQLSHEPYIAQAAQRLDKYMSQLNALAMAH
jgi:amino acid adenylation domain-containing protein